MDFLISNYYSCSSWIFYRVLSLSFLTTNSTDAAAQVVSLETLDIFNLESLQVKVIKSQYSNCILHLEAQHKCFQEVSGFLNSSNIYGIFASLNIAVKLIADLLWVPQLFSSCSFWLVVSCAQLVFSKCCPTTTLRVWFGFLAQERVCIHPSFVQDRPHSLYQTW